MLHEIQKALLEQRGVLVRSRLGTIGVTGMDGVDDVIVIAAKPGGTGFVQDVVKMQMQQMTIITEAFLMMLSADILW